jgi:type VI secretion system protein ImpC
MPKESLHRKLERVRPPRVHIAYEVEAGGAVERTEVPFVVGVMSDLSGPYKSSPPLRLSQRNFHDIDLDNFNDVLAAIQPRVRFSIASSLSSSQLDIDLQFHHIDDFEPENVLKRVGPLRELSESTTSLETQQLIWRHLDRILHAPEFQRLEAAWRALRYLLCRTETGPLLKIKVMDVSKKELLRDLARAPEFDRSSLFKKLYEEPYGSFGGNPFGLLIGDYEFDMGPEDMELLKGISAIAAGCLAPFIAAADPKMFGIENFAQLAQIRDVARVFDSTEFTRWRAFRDSEDSRYVALTLPRILVRSPYGLRPATPGAFQYEEDTRSLLFGNSAYSLGICVADAFSKYGWCGAIRGIEGGGLVDGLPVLARDVKDEGKIKSGVEVLLSDRIEKELADLGFIPLVYCKGTDYAVFFSTQSCHKPEFYDQESANANVRLSCQLQYVLTTSRFMHYLKLIVRDGGGSFRSRGDWERFLNSWISSYVLSDDAASQATKAQYPLREARIEVVESPGRPGVYRAVAYLRPHFQIEELSVSLRVVTDFQ